MVYARRVTVQINGTGCALLGKGGMNNYKFLKYQAAWQNRRVDIALMILNRNTFLLIFATSGMTKTYFSAVVK